MTKSVIFVSCEVHNPLQPSYNYAGKTVQTSDACIRKLLRKHKHNCKDQNFSYILC